MKDKWKNNLGLKIGAFAFAVFLWWTVVNVEDPIQTKRYTTEVMFANTDVVTLDLVTLKNSLGFDSSINITAEISLYDPDGDPTVANVRGWYLTLTYDGVSTKGFASNSEGVFDS